MSHSEQLRAVLELWKVKVSEASPEFQQIMRQRFACWSGVDDFLNVLPSENSEVGGVRFTFCYLWSEKWMLELLTAIPSNTRFVPVGTLVDGSRLCLDTSSQGAFAIGAFSFESTVKLSLDKQLAPNLFRKFPFSYAGYLKYLFNGPADYDYLVG